MEVKKSFLLWLLAIAAGVFEMAIAVTEEAVSGAGIQAGLFIAVGIRIVIYAVLVWITVQMFRGRNGARIALAILLGGIGMASLIYDPIEWLAQGNSLANAFDGTTVYSILFAVSRIVHISAVILAVIFMFRPAANRYYRSVSH
ncbi:hypothetical protein ACFQZE_18275 [Paenibacillus sp. GCM10027627]